MKKTSKLKNNDIKKQQTWFSNWINNKPEKISSTLSIHERALLLRKSICDMDEDLRKLTNDRQRSIDKLISLGMEEHSDILNNNPQKPYGEWQGKLLINQIEAIERVEEGLLVGLARCSLPSIHYQMVSLSYAQQHKHESKLFYPAVAEENQAVEQVQDFGVKAEMLEKTRQDIQKYLREGLMRVDYMQGYSLDFGQVLTSLSRL